jgi:integrase
MVHGILRVMKEADDNLAVALRCVPSSEARDLIGGRDLRVFGVGFKQQRRYLALARERVAEPGIIADAFRLMLVTAQRRGEVLSMRGQDVNGTWWTIPAEVAKNGRSHRVPLSFRRTAASLRHGDPQADGQEDPEPRRARRDGDLRPSFLGSVEGDGP